MSRFRLLFSFLLVSFLAFGAALAALSFPALTGRVVDDAGILSQATQQRLNALLAEHEKQTGNQVVVVTLKDLGGTDIETYGYQLGRAWGIGQKGKNNGVLIEIAPNQRKVRIDVGYGLEGELTDAQSKLITENVMKPEFKRGDYDTGVVNGTIDVLRTLGGKPTGAESVPEPQQQDDLGTAGSLIVFLLVFFFIVFGRFLWPFLFLGGGGGWGGGGGGGWSSGGGGFSGGGGSFGGGGASSSW